MPELHDTVNGVPWSTVDGVIDIVGSGGSPKTVIETLLTELPLLKLQLIV